MFKSKNFIFLAYFSLVVGGFMFLAWLFLIAYGDVEEYREKPISYVFHWISELTAGILLLTAGIKTLGKKKGSKNLAFLSLGFLLVSIGGAFFYYLQNFEIVMFAGSGLILGTTIIMIIINYRSLQNFIMLSIGMSIYGLVNILGESIQANNYSSISMATPTLLFLIILAVTMVKRDLIFTHTDS